MNLHFQDVKTKCITLIKEYCSSRDESHDINHSFRVLNTSIDISSNYDLLTDRDMNILCAAAILHDFADHKYSEGTDLAKILSVFLHKIFTTKEAELILNIIERISFSREVKKGTSDWNILGKKGLLLRNIISDADKIDATGVIGLKRCIEYTKSKNPEISKKDLITAVKKHMDEKLCIIDKYCRTPQGKYIVETKISELNDEFLKWSSK